MCSLDVFVLIRVGYNFMNWCIIVVLYSTQISALSPLGKDNKLKVHTHTHTHTHHYINVFRC